MKTTVSDLDDNKVKFSVEIPADQFEVEVDKAFKKIARDVKLPGFRKGKVPRRVLEAKFGAGIARGQALEDSIPNYFLEALSSEEVDIISPPEYEITSGEEEGDLAFDAVVEVRPSVAISGYEDLTVEVTGLEPSDDDVQERVDGFLRQFAELGDVERPGDDGDTVTIDIATKHEGEDVEGLTADDYAYRVGSGGLVEELDDNLRGAKIGDILEFDADHPAEDEDGKLEFRVLVKKIQEQVLPELTDELVSDSTDFTTVEDYRADIEKQLGEARLAQAHDEWHAKSASQLGELIDDEPPKALVDGEVQYRVQDMAQRLAASGISFEQYLQMMGTDAAGMLEQMRPSAVEAVKVDMALRALAVAEGLEATDADIDEEFASIAEANNVPVDELKQRISTPNEMMLFRADISKRKAADWLLENVEVVDPDGNAIDTDALNPDSHDDDLDHTHEEE